MQWCVCVCEYLCSCVRVNIYGVVCVCERSRSGVRVCVFVKYTIVKHGTLHWLTIFLTATRIHRVELLRYRKAR